MFVSQTVSHAAEQEEEEEEEEEEHPAVQLWPSDASLTNLSLSEEACPTPPPLRGSTSSQRLHLLRLLLLVEAPPPKALPAF